MGFSEKVARDVERITVSSSLCRQGLSASPQLPGATAGVNGGLLASSSSYQLADSTNGHAGGENHIGLEGRWGGGLGRQGRGGSGEVNGGSGGEGGTGRDGGGGAVGKPTGVDGLSKSWQGNPDDDIIGG